MKLKSEAGLLPTVAIVCLLLVLACLSTIAISRVRAFDRKLSAAPLDKLRSLTGDMAELGRQYSELSDRCEKLEHELARMRAAQAGRGAPALVAPRHISVRQDGKGDYLTLREAFAAATPGSVIEIADGAVYSEFSLIWMMVDRITLRGAEGRRPTLDNSADTGALPVAIHAGNDWTIENLRIVGTGSSGGLYCGSRTLVRNCEFVNAATGITGGARVVTNCVFRKVRRPITIVGATDVLITHNVVSSDAGPAVTLARGSYRFVNVKDNILSAPFIYDFSGAVVTHLVSNHNCFHSPAESFRLAVTAEGRYSSLADWRAARGQDRDSIFADPKLEFTNGTVSLAADSPCRGKASDGGDIGLR